MSNLLFLTADDFELRKGTKGNIVCHDIPGYSLVLFYSTQCKYCKELIPVFKQLPGSISGCQFGMINVSKNKNIVHMSRNSIAPIEYVPYVILFINGKPSMRYDGPADVQTIQKFVIDVSNRFKGQNFNRHQGQSAHQKDKQMDNKLEFANKKNVLGNIVLENHCVVMINDVILNLILHM